jgi:hypothetical protein
MPRLQKFTTLLATLSLAGVLVVSGVPESTVEAAFLAGSGTSGDPYQIDDCAQLAEIDDTNANLAAHYRIISAISCASISPFTPLRNGTTYFTGSLDGGGFTISNLTLSCGTAILCGLFAATSPGASISNVTIDSPSLTSTVSSTSGASPYASVGMLVGEARGNLALSNITITAPTITASGDGVGGIVGYSTSVGTLTASNVSVINGSVTGGVMVGGLFGWVAQGTISSATSSTSVTASGVAGGIIGQGGTTSSTGVVIIDQAIFTGSVTTSLYGSIFSKAGGIAGQLFGTVAQSSRITRSQVTGGGISGDGTRVGGLVGESQRLIVANSYAAVSVDGNRTNTSVATNSTAAYVGGLVGYAQSRTKISDSYFDGSVTSTNATNSYRRYVGGLIGSTNGTTTISRSYSLGTVTGSSYVGGLVGSASSTLFTVLQSFSRSTVNYSKEPGSDYEGGLAGETDSGQMIVTGSQASPTQVATLHHSYFAGIMSPSGSSSNKYGLYGQGRASCSRTFFNTQTSGATLPLQPPNSPQAPSATTAELRWGWAPPPQTCRRRPPLWTGISPQPGVTPPASIRSCARWPAPERRLLI